MVAIHEARSGEQLGYPEVNLPELDLDPSILRDELGKDSVGIDLIIGSLGSEDGKTQFLFLQHDQTEKVGAGLWSHPKETMKRHKISWKNERLDDVVGRVGREEIGIDLSKAELWANPDRMVSTAHTRVARKNREYLAYLIVLWSKDLSSIVSGFTQNHEIKGYNLMTLEEIFRTDPKKLRECTHEIFDQLMRGGFFTPPSSMSRLVLQPAESSDDYIDYDLSQLHT